MLIIQGEWFDVYVNTSYVEVYDFWKYSTNQIFQSVKMLQLKSQSYRKMMMRDNLLAK